MSRKTHPLEFGGLLLLFAGVAGFAWSQTATNTSRSNIMHNVSNETANSTLQANAIASDNTVGPAKAPVITSRSGILRHK